MVSFFDLVDLELVERRSGLAGERRDGVAEGVRDGGFRRRGVDGDGGHSSRTLRTSDELGGLVLRRCRGGRAERDHQGRRREGSALMSADFVVSF